jgi:tryptophanyl-tRNA synthetase
VRDLQEPDRKMSTTGGTAKGTVYVDEDRDSLIKKFKGAQTDSGTDIVRAPDKPGISNLIEILAIVRGDTPEAIERDFAGSGYGAFKLAVGEEVADWLAPVRAAFLELRDDTDRIEDVLEAGAEKARAVASGVVADVREVMGVGPPASRQAARHRLRREEAVGAGAPRLGRSVGPAA